MYKFLTVFTFLLASLNVWAGGKIAGKITDEKTGDAIIGATVVLKGTANGTVTDVDGNFMLAAEAGTYVLEIKYIGYQGKEVEDVKVTNDNTVTVNVLISESKSKELKELVIRTSIKKENISSLYMLQKNNASISDGISADVIKKSPDRSTGEVLKRVSGTTIQDNKYVIVRGLSDRYNTALVDNAVLPSTEPNRKAFSFDIIPANLIDNIVITKTATPDLPADFAGGVINVLTKEIPEQNFTNISVGTGYNTVSTFKDFKSGYRTGTDILGFDDGSRQLPANMPGTKKVRDEGLVGDANINAIKSLNNDFSINTKTALPQMSLQASTGHSWLMNNNKRFGIIGAVTYNHNESILKDVKRQYNDFDFTDQAYRYSTALGAMVNAGYSFGANKIVLKSLYNRVFDDNFLLRTGNDFSSRNFINYYAFDLIQKSLFKVSLEGDHRLGENKGKLNWLLAYNTVGNDQPDQRKIRYTRPMDDAAAPMTADVTSSGKANNRLFSDLQDNIYSASVNYALPFNLFANKSTFKAGVFGQYRQRTFDARFLGLNIDLSKPDAEEVRQRPIDKLFSNDLVQKGYYKLTEQTGGPDKYDASTTTAAGYLMLDNKFSDKFRLVWGARTESFNLKLNSFNSAGKATNVDTTWIDVLPSANFTYSLNAKTNLRLSYYRTLARPELREMASFAYYDYELSALTYGDPKLVRSQIDNVDLRYELYPRAGEILSASVFYKHFKNPLEAYVYDPLSQIEIKVRNYTQANNVGAEVELRKNLGFISNTRVFNNTSFYANLAYIHSVVEGIDARTGLRVGDDRPLTGQSNYVINTSLAYSAMKGKLNFNVLYNRIGPRIYLVGGTDKYRNAYEVPRNLLDFQASYAVSKRSEFRLNIKDLLNAECKVFFDQNKNGKFDGVVKQEGSAVSTTNDWVLYQYRPGTTFSVTYTYKF